MTSMQLFQGFSGIDAELLETIERPQVRKRKLSRKRLWLIAAVAALALLLVGCAIAYAGGWLPLLFSARSDTPLSSEQVQYIQENEQPVNQVQVQGGWTVELKSSISDGTVGYLVFRVTAPENIDLEQYLGPPTPNAPRLIPGNYSLSRNAAYSMVIASIGTVDVERNYIYQEHGSWLNDHDGQKNTLLYGMTIQCERLLPEKPTQLKAPFEKDISFRIRFMGFALESTDTAVQESIAAEHSGKESYLVDGEAAAGLFRSEILTDEQWDFTVNFAPDSQFVELITHPVTAQARVIYAPAEEWSPAIQKREPIQIESFRVTPFGAEVRLEAKPGMHAASLDLSPDTGTPIYAVMKDGSQIALQENNQTLLAQTPIVLGQLDHVLLADGTVLSLPEK